jgi:regulator of cell morphogenesis and NO signaling
MIRTDTANATVGQLVVERPSRARIFESFGIDYCCGGKKPLAQACKEKGVETKVVIDLLQAFDEQRADAPEKDWSQASMTDLADHIESTHHAYLKRELPRLAFLVGKVAKAHGANRPQLLMLEDVFTRFKPEMESHMEKEEVVLFPVCRRLDAGDGSAAAHCGSVAAPIRMMVYEHEDAGAALRQMRELTDGYAPPPDACNTYRAMLDGLAELERDMHVHVHKENSILFPKAIDAESRVRRDAN